MKVTEADLLDALRAALTQRGEAPTVAELAAQAQQTVPGVRRALKAIQTEGRLEVVMVQRMALDGVLRQVPGYRIKAKAKAKR